MILQRLEYREDGIFSELKQDDGSHFCYTLDHAYPQPDGSYKPKLYAGAFTCVRGQHRLKSMTHSFETFEITGVVGHTDILFHSGNVNADSAGCLLLGNVIVDGPPKQVSNSRVTFQKFMDSLVGIDTFQLTVIA